MESDKRIIEQFADDLDVIKPPPVESEQAREIMKKALLGLARLSQELRNSAEDMR